ncbi:MAG: bifunctional [glutamate--ammonia ligase]-adenylyl-L-tyrosine phosphorylase/[glutamate--ammonia-ligase] adenylyltransferase [Gammaproteobacteria bacterium]|nr:bifunctional [glutamate--ammonia ligase]-adenylyl-L-tyrosine phosphorylase/[glutamate--ammonia-ligase] adenylyltransferase [Gammaproteobacteria bacterium]
MRSIVPECRKIFDRLDGMDASVDSRIIAELDNVPRPLEASVERWFETLAAQHDISAMPDEYVGQLVRVVACSEFAAGAIVRHWDWLVSQVASFPASDADFAEAIAAIENDAAADDVKASLRRIRHRAMLRILWREVCQWADLDETLRELSDLADAMLEAGMRHAKRFLEPRYGDAVTADGKRIPLVVLGMGKLGGRELNFSSDIDLIFLYTSEGETNGARSLSAQEYFGRLSRKVIELIDEKTQDGFVFRIDTRLRPFGASGPPVVGFAALESYLLQHGRDWERYAYVKARIVGSRLDRAVRDALYGELIRPFVYRRYLDYGVFESLRSMHAKIAAEVQRRELQDNIKLGPGGIREAEFIVQSLQLVRGGSDPALQGRELQTVLPKLVGSRGLSKQGATALRAAYRFLRRLENFIQGIRDQQTHDLPADDADRQRLALAMNYADWSELLVDLDRHRAAITEQFEQIAFRDDQRDTPFQQRAARAWESGRGMQHWLDLLQDADYPDAAEIARLIASFAEAPATQQVDSVSGERMQRFVPKLLAAIRQVESPGIALARVLTVVEGVLRRSAYISLLNENTAALQRLVDLCARSRYVSDWLARYPVLLDELLDPSILSGEVTKRDIEADLRQRLDMAALQDSEERMQVISQFQRSMMFRIAIADFSDSLPIMKVSDGLTWLAEAVLARALSVAWNDLVERHGQPTCEYDGEARKTGFGIIGYGKLGGLELSYGSDLDIVFLHDSRGSAQQTDGEKPLDNNLFYGRLVRRLVHFLTTQTASGALYEVDTRLRPDGQKGLLVTSIDAFERYQENNAWTWEHQALLRARAVAGSDAIAAEFARIRRETLTNRIRRDSLRDDVVAMRQRMRTELDQSDGASFDLKHGVGGIGDIEFLVQYLVLENASQHVDVIHYSDNIRQLDALVECGCVEAGDGLQLQDCYRSYRRRLHHLALDGQTPLVANREFAKERQFVAAEWQRWLA